MKLNFYLILFLLPLYSMGQPSIEQGIEIRRGKSTDFIIRSMYEIKNGKTLGSISGHTVVDVYFDTVEFYLPVVNGWELVAYANTVDMQSSYGAPNMNINKIVLEVTVNNGGIGYIKELSTDVNTVIATGDIDDGPNWVVNISYDCGKQAGDIGFLGVDPDYYETDIIIAIRPY